MTLIASRDDPSVFLPHYGSRLGALQIEELQSDSSDKFCARKKRVQIFAVRSGVDKIIWPARFAPYDEREKIFAANATFYTLTITV